MPKRTPENIFVIGTISYDFGAESCLNHFTQAMKGHPYMPDQLVRHLSQESNSNQASALIWTLKIDGMPIYAIQPNNQFAAQLYSRFVSLLKDQELNGVERVSIAGVITGETRLLNGQIVPTVSPILRAISSWNTFGSKKSPGISDFYNRVYYELRNRGVSSSERAVNYAATNANQMKEVFHDAISHNLSLQTISTEKSRICGPDSDCIDVVLEFFNPKERLNADRKLYRYTIDVSDVLPVVVGELSSWYSY